MMKNRFLAALMGIFSLTFAQNTYKIEAKPEFSFTEVKPFDNVKDILTFDDVSGFRFDPVRNKSVVELRFTIPNIKQYEFVFVERGDTIKGFTSCLIINLSQENINNETFVKIDKYPLPYAERTNYRIRAVTKDGIIRYYPYIIELREGDLESREQEKIANEKKMAAQKQKDATLLKEWENNKATATDESWRNVKPEVVSGGRLVDGNADSANSTIVDNKTDMEKKLDKVKQIEKELTTKLDELKKLMESIVAQQKQ